MKRNFVIGALGAAVLAAAMAFQPVAAGAQAAGQVQSNQSVGEMAARIDQDISALNGDDTDYGGHRLKAIAQMQKAHNALAAAEQYATSHGMGAGASMFGAAVGTAAAAFAASRVRATPTCRRSAAIPDGDQRVERRLRRLRRRQDHGDQSLADRVTESVWACSIVSSIPRRPDLLDVVSERGH